MHTRIQLQKVFPLFIVMTLLIQSSSFALTEVLPEATGFDQRDKTATLESLVSFPAFSLMEKVRQTTWNTLSSTPPATRPLTGTIPTLFSPLITTPLNQHKIFLPIAIRNSLLSQNFNTPDDGTVWIANVWVNASNNLYVRINGTPNYYRLYVRRVGATFGDPPHYQYYQIYPGGTWPKDLWIVTNVNPKTVYCVEIKSNNGSHRHDITSYRTGGGSPPYSGGIYLEDYCPVDYNRSRVRLVGSGSSLNINPSTPMEGQSVRATFGQICNDGAVTANLGKTYVKVNTGENWASVDKGKLICGQCKTINYSRSRTFSAGSKTATAGYYSGGWHAFGTRGGAVNRQTFNVLAEADVRLKNGTSLSLSKRQISPGKSVTAQFTVHNYGDVATTERFRAAIYDKTGANYIATFPATGDITLPDGGNYSYSKAFTFNSAGVYWIKAQHRVDGEWIDLAGNGRLSLRVYVPPPSNDPKVKGYAPPCPHAGEPVNTATGNFTSEHTDWTRPGPGLSFTFRRFYNSIDADTTPGPLGYGWTHSYQYGFDWRVDDTVVITLTDGHIAYFVGDLGTDGDPDPGTYTAEDGVLDTLIRYTQDTPGVWEDDTFELVTPDQVHYYFDTDQRLIRIQDRSDNTQTFSYDGNGNLLQMVDTANITYTFVYSGNLVTNIASSNGEHVFYSYDANDNLIAFTNTASETMTYTYDENHRLLTGIDPSGRLFVENVYDDQGRVIEQRDAEGYTSIFGYDRLTQTTIYTDALGNPLIQIYDDQARLIKEIDALGYFITNTYDLDDNVIATRDRNGNVTRYTYDDQGNMLTKMDALGYVWTYTYDEQNNLLTKTDPLSNTTTYEYNGQGQLIRKTDPEGSVWEYAYNEHGLVSWSQDPVGAETSYQYNELGLPVTVTNALSQTTLLGYDEIGRKLSYTDAEGNAVRFAYDGMGRTKVITAPDGGLTTFSYDSMGNLVSETNPLGYTRVFTYDAYNRLVAETDWGGNVTYHEHDVLGRPIKDIDPLGYTTVYTYDAVGNLVAQRDKNGNITTYTYDPSGNRLTETDPMSHTMTYVYDALNRVVEVIAPCACAGSSHRYTEYDAAGRVIREIDALGYATTFEYDQTGRLLYRTNALSETTSYTYDAAGRLKLETDPLGQQTRYDYDLLGQLITTTDRLGYTTVQGYDAAGRVVEKIDERGYVTTQAYDSADRLTQVNNPLSQTVTYTYDLLGNKLTETDALGHTNNFTYNANNQLLTATDANGHTTAYTYDALGQLIRERNSLGGLTRYTYDPNGNMLTETDPLGHTTVYQYDALGRQVKMIDAEGDETTYGYDEAGNLISQTDAEGNVWTYEYDANHNLIAETDPRGYTTRYEYDALNRQVKMTDPMGGNFITRYDPLGRVAETMNERGQRTGYTYDGEGHVLALTDALGFYSTRVYDPAGNMLQMTDRRGYTATYAYDPLNRQTVMTDALGGEFTWGYDELGRVITETDQLGRKTVHAYDPVGNLITETDALGNIIIYSYDALNRQVSFTDPNGHTTSTHYDAAGRVVSTTLPSGGEISYAYDKVGNRLSETDPAGRTRHWEYDGIGRTVREIDPLGNATEYVYDGVGNLTQERDALGRETNFTYDALNRLIQVTDAAGYETRYIYDPVGNLIRQQDANGLLTQFVYDARNQQIREVNPLGQNWLYQYDAEGNQTGLMKPDGTVIIYQYDALKRLVSTDYDDGTPDVTFTYNAVDDRLTMTDGTGTTRYAYDAIDQLIGIIYPNGAQVGYEYDNGGNRTHVNYPFSGQAIYAFDADDNLQTVTTSEGVISYTRDPSGLPLRIDYPNGAYIACGYDDGGQLTSLTNGNATGTFAHYAFVLNEVGNKIQEIETLVEEGDAAVVTTLYAYDARDQLLSSVASDGIETYYTFDAAGNRVQMTGVRQREGQLEPYTVDYAYNAVNQLLIVTDSALGATIYNYDANGNRAALLSLDRKVHYDYDAEDRLVAAEVLVPDGEDWVHLEEKRETYDYDGQSRRVRKTALDPDSGVTLWQRDYLYGSDWNVLQETTMPTTIRRYIYDDAMQRLQVLVGEVAGYLHSDGLGSAVGYTESDGTLRNEDGLRRYGDYGDVLDGGAGWWTDTAYTGHEREEYSGLYYAKHRYYDPDMGVWLTIDSDRGDLGNPLSLHRYAYVSSNPINLVDPLGLREVAFKLGELNLSKYCKSSRYPKNCELAFKIGKLSQFRRLGNKMWNAPFSWLCRQHIASFKPFFSLHMDWSINYDEACRHYYGGSAYHILTAKGKLLCYKSVTTTKNPPPVITKYPSDPDPVDLCLRLPWESKIGSVEVTGDRTTHRTTRTRLNRHAIDFGLNAGTPVLAAHSGFVVRAAYDSKGGNVVTVCKTKNGKNQPCSVYAHLQSFNVTKTMRPGPNPEKVLQGQQIGLSGNTGIGTGAHLHFGLVAYWGGPEIPAIFVEIGHELTKSDKQIRSSQSKR